MQIPVIGLSDVPGDLLEELVKSLNQDFKKIRFLRKGSFNIPEDAYNKFRDQYMAERVMDHFRKNGIQLLITDKEVYGRGMTYVFGQGEYRGPMIVSAERLRPEFYDREPDQKLLLQRIEKEAIHQLGHCFGLKHCGNPGCVMGYSKSVKDVDGKDKNFCEECQVKISTQGLELE